MRWKPQASAGFPGLSKIQIEVHITNLKIYMLLVHVHDLEKSLPVRDVRAFDHLALHGG